MKDRLRHLLSATLRVGHPLPQGRLRMETKNSSSVKTLSITKATQNRNKHNQKNDAQTPLVEEEAKQASHLKVEE